MSNYNLYSGLINPLYYPASDTRSVGVPISIQEHYELRREGLFGGSNPYSSINYLSSTILHLVPSVINDTMILDGTSQHDIYNIVDDPSQLGDFTDTPAGAYYSAEQVKYGPTSIKFNASSSLVILNNGLFNNLSSSDFTIEWWEYRTSTNAGAVVTRWGLPGSYAAIMTGYVSSTNVLMYISTTGTSWALSAVSMGTASLNTWTHRAIVRNTSANSVYGYQDGVLRSTTVLSGATSIKWPYGNLQLCVNYPTTTVSTQFEGYIEDFCISLRAKYGAGNFTPTRITQ